LPQAAPGTKQPLSLKFDLVRDLGERREHSNTLSKVVGGDRRWCASQRQLGVEIEELAGCGTWDHNVSKSTRKFLLQANMLEAGVVPRR
jgi:hypothetical protein